MALLRIRGLRILVNNEVGCMLQVGNVAVTEQYAHMSLWSWGWGLFILAKRDGRGENSLTTSEHTSTALLFRSCQDSQPSSELTEQHQHQQAPEPESLKC
eukprot:TRINITY_DN22024_c0_g1_i1.p3 TRINITY_DN22024_c0_g1~~TRINITY_DN22024_c0_g1_i1.p3  ORF type:complete len:100 (+),score=10.37 TRINITY_DN22024_c0_g1_i1:134-433(+)